MRLVKLKSIYTSLSQAGISDEDIKTLPELMGKDLSTLTDESIRITVKRVEELAGMASQGTVSYSIQEQIKITRNQLRRIIKEELSELHLDTK